MGPPQPKAHASSRLFYRDGTSDKEYHASINQVEGGFTVTFAFGRRGTALTAGTKTSVPVPLEKAQQIYDRLISEKAAKGYTHTGSGALFSATDYEKRVSGLVPQLLNAIDEAAARRALRINPHYASAHDSLAQVLSHTGHPDEAVQECQEAIRLKPDRAVFYNSLGYALYQKGQKVEARQQWQRAASMDDADAASDAHRLLAQYPE